MKMRLSGHDYAAIIMSVFLTFLTFLAVQFSSEWNIRNIYNLFFFFLFNISLFLTNSWFFSIKRKFINEKLRKILRILVIVVYSFFYIVATFTYIGTGQITRLQTLIFLLNMRSYYLTVLYLTLIFMVIGIIVFFLYKKIKIKDHKITHNNSLKWMMIFLKILLLVTFLANVYFLKIENPLVADRQIFSDYKINEKILDEKILEIKSERYNVIFIMLESVSAERIGTYGYIRNITPNIDRIAENSIVFQNAYTTSTHSEYAQPAILSSRYMLTNSLRNLFDQDNPRSFIWDVFKANKYSTAYFSSQDDRWQKIIDYINTSNLDIYSYSMSDEDYDYGSGYAKKDFDEKTATKALNWIDSVNSTFFLYLNFQATHSPNEYPEEYEIFPVENNILPSYSGQYVENKYDNSLFYVDAQIGRFLDYLKTKSLENNTIIIITADHGHDLEKRHNTAGHGNTLYNDELLVPAIFYIPGTKGYRVTEKVSNIDFAPTILDFMGFEIPPEFQGEAMKSGRPIFSIAQSHRYLISLVQDDIKVVVDKNKELVEVYNITNDPQELVNIPTKSYEEYILKLLFWDYCQKTYYKEEVWKNFKESQCTIANNFKL